VAKKLSYREQRELKELPARIEALEAELRDVNAAVVDPLFYTKGADVIRASLARQDEIAAELASKYARWDALDSRSTRSSSAPSSASRSR
jgi:ATP-binding cassette subfamily F protein uup